MSTRFQEWSCFTCCKITGAEVEKAVFFQIESGRKALAHRIDIAFKKSIRDALGEKIKRRIIESLNVRVDQVRIIDGLPIDGRFDVDASLSLTRPVQ